MTASTKNFPDFIVNTDATRPVLRKVFGFHATAYNLNEYESISPGFGKRVWDLYLATEAMLKTQNRLNSMGLLYTVL